MTVTVRPMTLQETEQVIEYFHTATPEHLETLGVDPTRLPQASQWRRLYEQTRMPVAKDGTIPFARWVVRKKGEGEMGSMGCATCHDVKTEGETTTVTLTSPKDQLCFTCHDKAKEEVKHGPYEKGACVTCHDPHSSDFPKQLRAELNANFCLECHGPRKDVPEKGALFKPQEITRDEFVQIPKIFLSADQSNGHPIDRHPTTGVRNPMKPEEKLTCTSCHATHASTEAKLLPHADKEGRDVCAQCHVIVDSAHEDKAISEGKIAEAQRMQDIKKKNPDAGKPAKKRRGGEEQQ